LLAIIQKENPKPGKEKETEKETETETEKETGKEKETENDICAVEDNEYNNYTNSAQSAQIRTMPSLKSIYGENALFFLKDLQSDMLSTGFLPTDVSCDLLDILDACVTVKVSSVRVDGDAMDDVEFQVEVDPV
jgi:hypothetical protein